MPPEVRKLLADMAAAADSITHFARGRQLQDLDTDDLLRSGIYWKFVVIGEALSQLKRIDEPTYSSISESWRIVGFRNQIIHGYSAIKDTVTWQIIQDKVPVLRMELAELLQS
jgi:uncharacterized protein with HEPN domain